MRETVFALLNGDPGRIESLRKNKKGEVTCLFIDRKTWTKTIVFLEKIYLPKKSKKKVDEIIKGLKPLPD